jgi:hypothetical protein
MDENCTQAQWPAFATPPHFPQYEVSINNEDFEQRIQSLERWQNDIKKWQSDVEQWSRNVNREFDNISQWARQAEARIQAIEARRG